MNSMDSYPSGKGMPYVGRTSMAGFTLLELLITIAVVSIMIGIAVPSFRDMVANQSVRAAAETLHSSIVQARAEAVKRNTNVTLRPATGETWSNGWLIVTAAAPADSAAVHRERLAAGATVSAGSTASLVFRPSGRISGSASFELTAATDSSRKRCVTVSLDGRANTKVGGC